jgi:oxygen-independent coproporphyrinogen-3 oxidase
MAGIYLHIPFCKQACFYCNFHFTTSLRHKNELLAALLNEISLRSAYLAGEQIETIYFGGGTPSLLENSEVDAVLSALRKAFSITSDAEITLEANPDDISEERLAGWKLSGINRLSIGVQSFFEEDLAWMNRAHNADQAISGLKMALNYFEHITMDLIYGTPLLTDEKWKHNVDLAISLGVPHLSCYALTVEPKTALQKMIILGKKDDVDAGRQSDQFTLLMHWLEKAGYEHYEISNFAKPGFRSRHNSSYWQGKKYLGLGPSAHSFNGSSREWNVANNSVYIESIMKGQIESEKEELTLVQIQNEYIMTSLRTSEGMKMERINVKWLEQIVLRLKKYMDNGLVVEKDGAYVLTKEGRLLADGIAADLFVEEI